MNNSVSRISLLALAATLSACAHKAAVIGDRSAAGQAEAHMIDIVEGDERLELNVASLSPDQVQSTQIDAFGRLYRSIGHGPLVVKAPSASAMAKGFAAQVRSQLVEGGVTFAALTNAAYEGSEADPVVISFTRYLATPPECRPVSDYDLAARPNNNAYEGFGCSDRSNLAAMIADPADLLEPRSGTATGRDSARREVIFDKFRKGEPSHAERSTSEQVGVQELGDN